MNYEYNLCVKSELDEVVVEISAPTLELLEEKFRSIEKMIKDYEGDKEVQAQAEIDRQKEEVK